MNTTYKKYYSFFWLCFLCGILLTQNDINAQVKSSVTIEEKFDLGATFGERYSHKIEIDKPGQINIKVSWDGSAAQLVLILTGPGQENYYARKEGKSPMDIDFNITPDLIAKGRTWTISIVNFRNSGSARGDFSVKYPVKSEMRRERPLVKSGMMRESPMVIERKPQVVKRDDDLSSSISQENTIQRIILEDGTVQIRYPDGTIKHVFGCGYMIFRPDGTSIGTTCLQVQPTTPPSLPGDDRIIAWLDWQAEGLLDLIKVLLEGDENSIKNFVNKEGEIATNIYEKMYVRTNYINRLLSN